METMWELVSSKENERLKVALYHKEEIELFMLALHEAATDKEHHITFFEEEFSIFIDCILDAIENVQCSTENSQTISTIMESKEGYITVGFGSKENEELELIVSQGDDEIRIAYSTLDECLIWLLREFYLLYSSDS